MAVLRGGALFYEQGTPVQHLCDDICCQILKEKNVSLDLYGRWALSGTVSCIVPWGSLTGTYQVSNLMQEEAVQIMSMLFVKHQKPWTIKLAPSLPPVPAKISVLENRQCNVLGGSLSSFISRPIWTP